ncbi:hypothetical protein [Chondromyces apiculatus]|uniref:TauD/TfdA-like domain-containing protein n=1 Tax=Chondromyces apiculatus DSM 436 TaxID=1192034 RepID=A0A017T4I8_9BACT|nr:hypothetical protein [Chondromyces apiculatus]EYF04129.1 Hypothetical protein CAP_4812 [Chondromyces apiculatus DSM 436]
MDAFAPTQAPAHARGALADAPWCTWSNEARDLVTAFAKAIGGMAEPALLTRPVGPNHDVTYSLPVDTVTDPALREGLLALAEALYHRPLPEGGILLLSGLSGGGAGGRAMHSLLALLRDALSALGGDGSAHYAPIAPAEGARSAFPLHADLFRSPNLLSVFDDVPADDSGTPVFLSTTRLLTLIHDQGSMPEATRRRIVDLLLDRSGDDRYDDLFDLLHGTHPWTYAIEKRMHAARIALRLRPGEGYLVDDRRWLHGREPQTSDVTSDRVRRLTFASATMNEGVDALRRELLAAAGLPEAALPGHGVEPHRGPSDPQGDSSA